MSLKTMTIGKNVSRPLLALSLFLIFIASVVSSKFDCWYAMLGGAIMAAAGSYISTLSIKWVTEN